MMKHTNNQHHQLHNNFCAQDQDQENPQNVLIFHFLIAIRPDFLKPIVMILTSTLIIIIISAKPNMIQYCLFSKFSVTRDPRVVRLKIVVCLCYLETIIW